MDHMSKRHLEEDVARNIKNIGYAFLNAQVLDAGLSIAKLGIIVGFAEENGIETTEYIRNADKISKGKLRKALIEQGIIRNIKYDITKHLN